MKLKVHMVQRLRCTICNRRSLVMLSRQNVRCGCTVVTCWRGRCKYWALRARHYVAS